MSMIMSFVIISFKNMSVTKLLKLQDDVMSSQYDKKIYPDNIEHCQQIVYTLSICNKIL